MAVVLRRPATSAPQATQKRAPGTSCALHSGQAVACRLAPHEGQNLPLEAVPQFGHFMAPRIEMTPGRRNVARARCRVGAQRRGGVPGVPRRVCARRCAAYVAREEET
jgi:hypothetical protein